ncbi:MAG: hypothetical protein Q8O62_06005 [Aequorivita sp.]|nr:hypothetical protein [Aequorivita sp.]
MKNRCTKIEKEKRAIQVQDWIIEGSQDNVILRKIKTEWDISLQQARKYLNQAYNNWMPDQRIDIENRRAAKIAELKQDLLSMRDEFKGTPAGMNARARIHKLIIKLEDLEPAKKHKIEATVSHSVLTPEQRDARIKELMAKFNNENN